MTKNVSAVFENRPNAGVNKIWAIARMKEFFLCEGVETATVPPTQFSALTASDIVRCRQIVMLA